MDDRTGRPGARRPNGREGQSQGKGDDGVSRPRPLSDTGELYTVAELADLWKVSQLTIRRLVHDGALKVVYVGGKLQRIPRASAREYLARNTRDGQGPDSTPNAR